MAQQVQTARPLRTIRLSARRPQAAHTIAKRAFDLLASAIGLLLLAPLFLLIAVLIKLDSPGPVFYRGTRVGKGGKPFAMWKFRTMADAPVDDGPRITAGDDPRITRLGAVLRHTKLNELPQLLNVLRGQMSLVGPRPEDPQYVALYTPEQRAVLAVKPGITSFASIFYRAEEEMLSQDTLQETYTTVIMPDKLALDLQYLDHRNLLVDLDVLWRTALVLLPRVAEASPEIEDLLFGPLQQFIRRHLSWFSLDLMAGFLAVTAVSLAWRHTVGPFNVGWPPMITLAIVVSALYSLVNQLWGLQHSLWSHSSGRELLDLALATAASTALLLAGGKLGFDLPYEWALLVGVSSFSLFAASRYRGHLARGLWLRTRALWPQPAAEGCQRTLIVGTSEVGRLLARRTDSERWGRHYRVVGFVDDDLTKRDARLHGLRVLGTSRTIPDLVAQHDVDLILVALENPTPARRQAILEICHSTPARVQVIPDVFEYIRQPARQDPPAAGRPQPTTVRTAK